MSTSSAFPTVKLQWVSCLSNWCDSLSVNTRKITKMTTKHFSCFLIMCLFSHYHYCSVISKPGRVQICMRCVLAARSHSHCIKYDSLANGATLCYSAKPWRCSIASSLRCPSSVMFWCADEVRWRSIMSEKSLCREEAGSGGWVKHRPCVKPIVNVDFLTYDV